MLTLGSGFNYYFCAEPVTLRYRHKGLRHYIKSQLHRDPTNGDVYIFLSDTLRESVVAGVREEVRKEMRQEYQGIIDEKDARIAVLEAMQNHGKDVYPHGWCQDVRDL